MHWLMSTITVTVTVSTAGHKATNSRNTNEEIETNRCAAYEFTSLSRQKVLLESNPAYEQIECYSTSAKTENNIIL